MQNIKLKTIKNADGTTSIKFPEGCWIRPNSHLVMKYKIGKMTPCHNWETKRIKINTQNKKSPEK